jgi:hypothetical protein
VGQNSSQSSRGAAKQFSPGRKSWVTWERGASPRGTIHVLTHTLQPRRPMPQKTRALAPEEGGWARIPGLRLGRAHSSAHPRRYSLGLIVVHKTEPLLTVRSAEITVHSRLGLRVGRIYGIFFWLFESSIQVAITPAHSPETARHEHAAWPTRSLPKVKAPIQLCADCNSIAASISSLVDFPDNTFPVRISANRSMPETSPPTATLQFMM